MIFPTREQAIRILSDVARERLRPTLPPCWKCDVKHWPVEPCDDTPVPSFPRILARDREVS